MGIMTLWNSLSRAPHIIWMDCIVCPVIPINSKCVCLLRWIFVDDSCVGHLAQFLIALRYIFFIVAWLHGFENAFLHSLCLNDDCWLYRQFPFRCGM
jgi:hypothetical protein